MADVAGEQREIAAGAAAPDLAPRGTALVSVSLRLLGIGPLLILVVLAAVISLLTPDFLKPGNLSNIVASTW